MPEESGPAIPEYTPRKEGALSVPQDWDSPAPKTERRTEDEVPEPVRELTGERDATREVWENADGTETVEIHSQPVNYQPEGSEAWEPIDNRLVPDPSQPGWVRNAANDWRVSFGPIEGGGRGGMELLTDAGPTRAVPELPADRAAIAPVVGTGDDADMVTYPGVWPGVDVVYSVAGGQVKEEIVVHNAGSATRASFPFVVEGMGLVDSQPSGYDATAPDITGVQVEELELAPAEIVDGDGNFVGDAALADMAVGKPAAGVTDSPAVPGAAQRLTVSVSPTWLQRELSTGRGPVIVDPTVNLGAWHYGWYNSDGTSCVKCGTARMGNNFFGGADLYSRSVMHFDYWTWLQGKQLLYAGLDFTAYDGTTPDAEWIGVHEAIGDSYAGAIGYGDPVAGANVGTAGTIDVSELIGGWHYQGAQGKSIGLVGDESPGWHTHKKFNNVTLRMNVNTPPPGPALVAPAANSLAITTTTPTLSWNPVTDPDGDAVTYTAKIATGVDGESGLVATSSPGTATSWQVPAGVLRDGVTYYWRVWAKDATWYGASEVRKLTVDRRLGAGGLSPTDAFSGVTTNLVTGNAALAVGGPDMTTVGGGIGVDFAYNSLTDSSGLRGEYRSDSDGDRVIEASDPLVLVRVDPQISFDWRPPTPENPSSSPFPSPGVPEDHFTVRWTGSVALPAGRKWQFGRRSDDGMRIWVDGTLVVDTWAGGAIWPAPQYGAAVIDGGGVHAIRVEYDDVTGPAQAEVWARNADNPSEELIVPASWFSQDTQVLPKGWSLQAVDLSADYTRAQVSDSTVTLYQTDGSALAFAKSANGYTPPEGIDDVVVVNSDGTVTVLSGDGSTYLFRSDGALNKITSALDDRKPAAAQPSYDSKGRITSLTDPVSGRSVTFTYAGTGTCTTTPPFSGAGGFTPAPPGMLCRVDFWDGTATELFYKNGFLAYVRNAGDEYTGFGYDTAGRLNQHLDPLAFDAAFTGVPDWQVLYTQIGYDPQGRVSSVARPPRYGSRQTRTYSYAPNVASSGVLVDGNASVTRSNIPGTFRTVTYDSRARTTTETDVAGLTTHSSWNADDQVTSVDGPDGLRTTTIYNNLKRPTDTWGPAPTSMFNPDGTGTAGVPHEVTRYDEDMDGLQVAYWDNIQLAGTPKLHTLRQGNLHMMLGAASPATGIPVDNWSARLTGKLVFPQAGSYQLQAFKDDKIRVFIDDKIIIDAWDPGANWTGKMPFTTAAANEVHRIRVDFADGTGDAGMHVVWFPPGATASEDIPTSLFKPDLGLVTSAVDADGKTTKNEYTDTAAGIGPQHGLAVKSIVDPGGLNLTETTAYETVGSGFLRRVSRTLPAGADTKTTNTYYGDTESRDNPCTLTADPAIQGGLVKLDTAADPDGTGSQVPIVREAVYDSSGRVVASRIGSESWICTTYDSRSRVKETKYPAFGGQPARTVTNNYSADPDGGGPLGPSPLVHTVTDAAGTIQTELDVLGEPIFYTDIFGNKTTSWYDDAGRQYKTGSPVGEVIKWLNNADQVTAITRDGHVVASNFVYGTGGRLDSVTYPSGSGNGGNGTTGTFRYNTLGRLDKVTWKGPGGTTITSDEVTRTVGGDIVNQTVDGVDHHTGNDYVYDNANRLTEAWVPGRHLSYRYAATGGCGSLATAGANTNRTSQIIEGGATTNYCYDKADRLTSTTDAAVGSLTYDGHGNTAQMFGETHAYDAADRHISTVKGTTNVTYKRDATDRIIERKLNGTIVARYGSTGSGDIADFTTDANNVLQEVTFPLPGGVLLTTRATGNVWSYPNVHGDVVATTDQAGTKQGSTTTYDPYGNLVAGALPDNSAGNLDYGWLGQHQRPLEHEAALQSVIEMGARQYSPLLGRFLEVDLIEGGSANDYDYVKGDPINLTDLNGEAACRYDFSKKGNSPMCKALKKAAAQMRARRATQARMRAMIAARYPNLKRASFHSRIMWLLVAKGSKPTPTSSRPKECPLSTRILAGLIGLMGPGALGPKPGNLPPTNRVHGNDFSYPTPRSYFCPRSEPQIYA